MHLSLTKYAQWDTDNDLIAETYDSVQEVKEALPDDAFYRIDAYGAHNNLGLWFDKSCLQFFNSTVAPSIMEFYPEVGCPSGTSTPSRRSKTMPCAGCSACGTRWWLRMPIATGRARTWTAGDLVGSTSAYQIYENKNWVPWVLPSSIMSPPISWTR